MVCVQRKPVLSNGQSNTNVREDDNDEGNNFIIVVYYLFFWLSIRRNYAFNFADLVFEGFQTLTNLLFYVLDELKRKSDASGNWENFSKRMLLCFLNALKLQEYERKITNTKFFEEKNEDKK